MPLHKNISNKDSRAPKAAKVHFHFNLAEVTIRDRTSLKSFIESIFKREKKRLAEIHYIFCSDDFISSVLTITY